MYTYMRVAAHIGLRLGHVYMYIYIYIYKKYTYTYVAFKVIK